MALIAALMLMLSASHGAGTVHPDGGGVPTTPPIPPSHS